MTFAYLQYWSREIIMSEFVLFFKGAVLWAFWFSLEETNFFFSPFSKTEYELLQELYNFKKPHSNATEVWYFLWDIWVNDSFDLRNKNDLA